MIYILSDSQTHALSGILNSGIRIFEKINGKQAVSRQFHLTCERISRDDLSVGSAIDLHVILRANHAAERLV